MRVLLTGHLGYIGTVAAPMLRQAGHEVVGLDTGLFEACHFGDLPPGPEQEIRRDLRDLEPEDLDGIEGICHLAALSNDPLGDVDPELTRDINLGGTVRLAKLAREAGARRFVFASSCSSYGAAGDDFLDEQAEFNPVTPYAVAKVEAERALAELASDGFSPVFMRNATAYGASPRLRLDLVLNNLVAHAHLTGRVFLMSDGTPWRPIVHLRDIVSAMIAALDAPREAVHGEAFNVCRTEENYRIRELAEIVAELVPGSRLEYAADAAPDKRTYRVDGSKIADRLPGWQPQWDARRGAEEMFEAYRRVGLEEADLSGPRYIRLKQLRRLLEAGAISADLRPAGRSAAVG